ncbi:MAG: S8 family serine peptidase [Lewinellaceae bacterium]|nr:S8 family serine peptidase [Lewinellaceae bacterium]
MKKKEIVIPSDRGPLKLRKSKQLVGLKIAQSRGLLAEEPVAEEEIHQNIGGFQVVTLPQDNNRTLDEQLDQVRERDDVEVGTHVYYPEGSNRPLVPTGDIFFTFEEGSSAEEQGVVLDEFHLELIERRGPYEIQARVTPQSMNPLKVAAAAQESCLVKLAEPDFDTILDSYSVNLPPDGLLRHQWHLQNNGFIPDAAVRLRPGADARVVDAWNRLSSLGSSDITVAIIDNGFDLTHPDLKTKVFRPFDLWNQSPTVAQGDSRYTHGTPCASVALAAANGAGIVGVAPNARFMPVSGTSFSSAATEQMFDYCVLNGADIISCSWGTTDPAYRLNSIKIDAIARAARNGRRGKGCVILFAVGNEGGSYVNFYASHPDVIAVAASTSQDQHPSYSNIGRDVTICAPSNGDWPITAARAWWDPGWPGYQGEYRYWIDGRSRGNNYKHFGGTSSATPLVAGVCALILSANPDLTAREVKDILIQTADKIGNPAEYTNGHSIRYGYGRVNAGRAVAEAFRRRGVTTPAPTPVGGTTTPTNQPPPTPTPAPPSTPAPTTTGLFEVKVDEKPPSRGWGVQIGAYTSYDNVIGLVNQIKRQYGESVYVHVSQSGSRTIYRVIVGAYAQVSQAQNTLNRLKRGGINGFLKNLADL